MYDLATLSALNEEAMEAAAARRRFAGEKLADALLREGVTVKQLERLSTPFFRHVLCELVLKIRLSKI